jgi:hypothetical protein
MGLAPLPFAFYDANLQYLQIIKVFQKMGKGHKVIQNELLDRYANRDPIKIVTVGCWVVLNR